MLAGQLTLIVAALFAGAAVYVKCSRAARPSERGRPRRGR
jgi:hypothetical protein